MKFSSDQDIVCYKGSELIKDDKEHLCWNCKEPTVWIDINFQAPLCSEECEDAKWKEYFKAEALKPGL